MGKQIILPTLPRGQGSMRFVNNGTAVRYRKTIVMEDGKKINLSVTKDTPNECMKEMIQKEKAAFSGYVSSSKKTLYAAMVDWVELSKKNSLKIQSYRTIRNTVNNQIKNSEIGYLRYQSIKPDEIRRLLTDLNNVNYSYSTIKKTYDALAEFFREKSYEENFRNPMANVKMIKRENIKQQVKQVEFFDLEDIVKFRENAISTWETGKPRYKYGAILAANIFLGLRAGELLALTWKDIDWEKKTIRIDKTLIIDDGDDFDYYMDQGTSKHRTKSVVQNVTKTNKVRYVPINPDAYDLLKLHYQRSQYRELNDFVISTYSEGNSLISTISDSLMYIEQRAQTKTQYYGTHVLRHTCASLMFKKGLPIELIASILGNSREVCEKIYVHFVEEQREMAVSMIQLDSFL